MKGVLTINSGKLALSGDSRITSRQCVEKKPKK